MTARVTGATGFLGSAMVTELIKRQLPVRIDESADYWCH